MRVSVHRRRLLLAGSSALLTGCSAADLLNALSGPDSSRVERDLAYGSDPRQRLDVYRPAVDTPSSPLVVFFPGGAWNRGERADYRFVGAALASQGCVAAVVDYRLYPQVRYPDFLVDCAAAVARLDRRFATGGRPIFLFGHSAGAYNASMLALDGRWLAPHGLSPQRLAGWIGLAGPYDFLPIRNPEVRPVFGHPEVPWDSQPIAHAGGSSLPALLGIPANDTVVDAERNSVALARALQAAGAPVTLRRYPRTDHALLVGALAPALRWLAPVRDDVLDFVRRHASARRPSARPAT